MIDSYSGRKAGANDPQFGFDRTQTWRETMANYYATARSNYFRVKDKTAFREWADNIPGLGVWDDREDGRVGVYDGGDSGGWPSQRYNEETEDYEDLDLAYELSEHLAEGEVAVLMEAGAEKMRYVCGYAIAVNHKGERITVSLNDIYDLAKAKFGVEPTDVS